jgi:hypothetical protein
MFHVELRQFPHKAWRFNLSEADLRAVAVPWAREEWLEFAERKWNPHEAKITILEGPQLVVQEIAMNRGWTNAQRRSEDITDRVLSAIRQAEEQRARAEDEARIEEAVRVRTGTPQVSLAPQPQAPVADPLTLGVLADPRSVAPLLGSQPTQLLAAWQAAAAASPGALPSETLALAERELASAGGNSG